MGDQAAAIDAVKKEKADAVAAANDHIAKEKEAAQKQIEEVKAKGKAKEEQMKQAHDQTKGAYEDKITGLKKTQEERLKEMDKEKRDALAAAHAQMEEEKKQAAEKVAQ